jgi:riboflavin-specific deaminase-like protein
LEAASVVYPKLTTFSELTIDGRLTLTPGGSSKALFAYYGLPLHQWFHAQRAAHDAIMVGSGTVRADNPELTVRYVAGANPLRVIPTNDGYLPDDAHVLRDGYPTLLAVPDDLPAAVAERLSGGAVELMRCGPGRVDLRLLLAGLAARGVKSLMVEGGSRLLAGLFAAGLVDRIVIKHIPVIAGCHLGQSAGSPFLDCVDIGLPLSRWQVMDWQVIGGVGVSVYEPMAGTER